MPVTQNELAAMTDEDVVFLRSVGRGRPPLPPQECRRLQAIANRLERLILSDLKMREELRKIQWE